MSKIIIFGVLDTAELAHYYLTVDSEHEVVAFTVHKKYLKNNTFKGLPIVAFEDINSLYPNNSHKLFAPMTGRKMNQLRESVFNEGKSMGYEFISYISTKATLFDNEIGENCFILEDNTIQPFTSIGNNVILWSGNHIGHHGRIDDHVFFTSHVVMSGHCHIQSHCFIGVNATIRDYTTLKKGTLLAMGASLTKQETQEHGVYVGNPAKLLEGKLSYNIY